MASTNHKMICPNCKVEMNLHCEKLFYSTDPSDAARIEPSLGGVLEQFFTCPNCGKTASRYA